MSELDRRTFLGASAATLGAAYLGCRGPDGPPVAPPEPEPMDGAVLIDFDPAALPENTARYPLGVQAGGMTATSATLWTWVEASAPGVLRVWTRDRVR